MLEMRCHECRRDECKVPNPLSEFDCERRVKGFEMNQFEEIELKTLKLLKAGP